LGEGEKVDPGIATKLGLTGLIVGNLDTLMAYSGAQLFKVRSDGQRANLLSGAGDLMLDVEFVATQDGIVAQPLFVATGVDTWGVSLVRWVYEALSWAQQRAFRVKLLELSAAAMRGAQAPVDILTEAGYHDPYDERDADRAADIAAGAGPDPA
jgi:hypothetical protein